MSNDFVTWKSSTQQSLRSSSKPGRSRRRDSNMLMRMTTGLVQTYHLINPKFGYSEKSNPRRVLTKPSERGDNQGFDNKDHDYILYVHDVLVGHKSNRYQVLDLLGKGTFGQVVKCVDLETGDHVAVKIVKNLPAFHSQGLIEVRLLQTLNSKYDCDEYPMVRMMDSFLFRNHLCLVFELLNVSLYELIRQNNFRGLSVKLVSMFTKQILTALTALHQSRIIHCDLKPENILLEDSTSANIKVIDFGSACFDTQAIYTYIQSRFYRSPEVILGMPYKMSIDVWSLGCIVFELFVGLPLFPGLSQHRMLMRFIKFVGMPSYKMLHDAKDTHKFFNRVGHTGTSADYVLKTDDEYSKYIASQTGSKPQPAPAFREYFKFPTIQQIVMNYDYKSSLTKAEKEEDTLARKSMLSFLSCVLYWDPEQRWTPEELLCHPFITGDPLVEPVQRPTLAVKMKHSPFFKSAASNVISTSSTSMQVSSSASNVSPNRPHQISSHSSSAHSSPMQTSSNNLMSGVSYSGSSGHQHHHHHHHHNQHHPTGTSGHAQSGAIVSKATLAPPSSSHTHSSSSSSSNSSNHSTDSPSSSNSSNNTSPDANTAAIVISQMNVHQPSNQILGQQQQQQQVSSTTMDTSETPIQISSSQVSSSRSSTNEDGSAMLMAMDEDNSNIQGRGDRNHKDFDDTVLDGAGDEDSIMLSSSTRHSSFTGVVGSAHITPGHHHHGHHQMNPHRNISSSTSGGSVGSAASFGNNSANSSSGVPKIRAMEIEESPSSLKQTPTLYGAYGAPGVSGLGTVIAGSTPSNQKILTSTVGSTNPNSSNLNQTSTSTPSRPFNSARTHQKVASLPGLGTSPSTNTSSLFSSNSQGFNTNMGSRSMSQQMSDFPMMEVDDSSAAAANSGSGKFTNSSNPYRRRRSNTSLSNDGGGSVSSGLPHGSSEMIDLSPTSNPQHHPGQFSFQYNMNSPTSRSQQQQQAHHQYSSSSGSSGSGNNTPTGGSSSGFNTNAFSPASPGGMSAGSNSRKYKHSSDGQPSSARRRSLRSSNSANASTQAYVPVTSSSLTSLNSNPGNNMNTSSNNPVSGTSSPSNSQMLSSPLVASPASNLNATAYVGLHSPKNYAFQHIPYGGGAMGVQGSAKAQQQQPVDLYGASSGGQHNLPLDPGLPQQQQGLSSGSNSAWAAPAIPPHQIQLLQQQQQLQFQQHVQQQLQQQHQQFIQHGGSSGASRQRHHSRQNSSEYAQQQFQLQSGLIGGMASGHNPHNIQSLRMSDPGGSTSMMEDLDNDVAFWDPSQDESTTLNNNSMMMTSGGHTAMTLPHQTGQQHQQFVQHHTHINAASGGSHSMNPLHLSLPIQYGALMGGSGHQHQQQQAQQAGNAMISPGRRGSLTRQHQAGQQQYVSGSPYSTSSPSSLMVPPTTNAAAHSNQGMNLFGGNTSSSSLPSSYSSQTGMIPFGLAASPMYDPHDSYHGYFPSSYSSSSSFAQPTLGSSYSSSSGPSSIPYSSNSTTNSGSTQGWVPSSSSIEMASQFLQSPNTNSNLASGYYNNMNVNNNSSMMMMHAGSQGSASGGGGGGGGGSSTGTGLPSSYLTGQQHLYHHP